MVFANLGPQEKDALFSLLDEYFASRPAILGSSKTDTPGTNPFRKEGAAAAAALGRASDAAAKFVSAGMKGVQGSSGSGSGKSTPVSGTAAASQHPADSEAETYSGGSVAERVAALRAGGSHGAGDKPGGGVSGLTSVRKFGDVDTTSAKGFISSLRNSSSNPPSSFQATHSNPVDNLPSAFPPRNSASKFGPPPTRAAAAATPPPPPPPPPQHPKPQEEEEEEGQGEWVEALYDYESSEPGDLNIKENQRILLVERTSDDWWTGEVDGMQGLFPASYVKLL